jgi:pyruvate dehydrogenase E1 component alpha subunit
VPRELLQAWEKRDPIESFRSWLRENASLTEDEEDEIASGVRRLLEESVRRAEESPLPDPEALFEGVYAEPEELDSPHFA